jgi:hypothetical protein
MDLEFFASNILQATKIFVEDIQSFSWLESISSGYQTNSPVKMIKTRIPPVCDPIFKPLK